MLNVVVVILPVFLLIFVGQLCRARDFPGFHFWAPAEKLTYYLLFPALLATTLASADFTQLNVLPMAASLTAAILLMTALAFAVRPGLALDGPDFTSFYQGVVRMNTYIGLSVALGLFGNQGLIAASVAVAVIVPLVNVCCIAVLTRMGSTAQPSLAGMLGQMLRNPLIIACALGATLNVSGYGLPPVIGDMLTILSRAALPLGLLAVGAALDMRAAAQAKRVAVVSSGLKLLVLPALTYLIGRLLGIDDLTLAVAVLFNALPTATSAYILAKQLGGNAPLMATLCTVQTFASMFTLPIVLALVAPA